jgi:hypothetical protein
MADDIRLVISVEQGSLLKAITNTESLEKRVKKLSDTYARGGVSYGRYNRGIEQLAKATKKSKDELLSHGTAIRANARAVEAAAIAEKQRLKVLREEKIALDQKNKAEAANSAELKRFRISTDQVYAAEQKLLRLKKMLRAEVDAGNMSMRQAAAVQMQYKRSLTALGGGMQQTARKTNQLGVMMQQTGYQVGDFFVQVGSGQNIMVAFGQQATQLVGTMAMFAKTTKMIALFSGLGILIPVISGIGAAFMRARKESDSFRSSTFDINEAAKNATIELKGYREELALLASEYKTLGEVGLEGQISEAQKELVTMMTARQKILEQAKTSFGAEGAQEGVEDIVVEGLNEITKEMNEQILYKKQQLLLLVQERESLERVKDVIGDTNSLIEDQKVANLERNRSSRQAVIDMQSELNLQRMIVKHGEGSLEVARHRAEQEAIVKNLTAESAKSYVELAIESYKVQLQIDASTDSAKSLSDALKEAVSAMASLASFSDGLDKKLAVSLAKVQALKSGIDDSIAGSIAGLRVDLAKKTRAAKGSGVDSGIIDRMYGGERAKILAFEASEVERKRLKANQAQRDYLEEIRHLMAVIHTESQTALEAETKKQLETVARIKQAYIALGLSKIQLEQAVARETALALAGSVDEQMTRANEFFSVATVEQEKLNKAAEELGTRLGLSFGAALDFIRQAKAEADVSLDAFGDAGDFKYSTASTFNPEVNTGGGSKADKLGDLNKQLGLERELLYLSEAQKRVINALGDDRGKYSAETIRGLVAEVEAIDKVNKKLEEQKSLSDKVSSSMSDAFMSIADGTTSASDAFRTMAADIIRELYKVLVVQRLVGSLTSIIGGGSGGGMFGNFTNVSANGNVFSGGSQVKAYANGGVVGRPTVFPMANGGVGLMGEAGPEAIMPLKRGANGKLGVQAEGGSGSGGVVIHQNFNFAANGDESVKRIIAQAAPHIANMTQKQIMDSRRRGGAMKATFS